METRNEKQVATKKAAPLPSSILFESDAHAGFENVKNTSVALPILKLLQNGQFVRVKISGRKTLLHQSSRLWLRHWLCKLSV